MSRNDSSLPSPSSGRGWPKKRIAGTATRLSQSSNSRLGRRKRSGCFLRMTNESDNIVAAWASGFGLAGFSKAATSVPNTVPQTPQVPRSSFTSALQYGHSFSWVQLPYLSKLAAWLVRFLWLKFLPCSIFDIRFLAVEVAGDEVVRLHLCETGLLNLAPFMGVGAARVEPAA